MSVIFVENLKRVKILEILATSRVLIQYVLASKHAKNLMHCQSHTVQIRIIKLGTMAIIEPEHKKTNQQNDLWESQINMSIGAQTDQS